MILLSGFCLLVCLLAGKGLLFAQQMTAYYFPQTWQKGTGSLFKTFTKAKISFMSARAFATVTFHRFLFLHMVTLGTRFQVCLLGEHKSSDCSISVPQLLSQVFQWNGTLSSNQQNELLCLGKYEWKRPAENCNMAWWLIFTISLMGVRITWEVNVWACL